jgi:uncharacterized membrane protein YhdT
MTLNDWVEILGVITVVMIMAVCLWMVVSLFRDGDR